MRFLSAALGLLMMAYSAPALAADGLRIVDLTAQFDRFAMTTADMPAEQRVAAFEREIGPIADGFYSRGRRPDDYELRVLDALHNYPGRRDGVLAISRDFNRLFVPARQKFEAAFGRVSSDRPVYLLDSMGELDGGTRELTAGVTLLFGADVIAEVHAGKDMTPFFYHELFHVYHEARVTGCFAIWCSLWAEGLATYADSRLASEADDDALILNLPKPIRPAVEANRAASICAVVRRMDSTTDEDFNSLFQGDVNLPGFPSRMGYYVGYLVASDIGRTHDLHSLAQMSMKEARPLIDGSLARMATCPAANAEARERSRTHRISS